MAGDPTLPTPPINPARFFPWLRLVPAVTAQHDLEMPSRHAGEAPHRHR